MMSSTFPRLIYTFYSHYSSTWACQVFNAAPWKGNPLDDSIRFPKKKKTFSKRSHEWKTEIVPSKNSYSLKHSQYNKAKRRTFSALSYPRLSSLSKANQGRFTLQETRHFQPGAQFRSTARESSNTHSNVFPGQLSLIEGKNTLDDVQPFLFLGIRRVSTIFRLTFPIFTTVLDLNVGVSGFYTQHGVNFLSQLSLGCKEEMLWCIGLIHLSLVCGPLNICSDMVDLNLMHSSRRSQLFFLVFNHSNATTHSGHEIVHYLLLYVILNPVCNNDLVKFPDNSVNLCRYTWYSFLPKSSFRHFKRLHNLFFLGISIFRFFSTTYRIWAILSGVVPYILYFLIQIGKDAWEDIRRYYYSRKWNSRFVTIVSSAEPFELKRVMSGRLRVGNMVYITDGEEFPADIVLLSASTPDGTAHVDTAHLDGTTDLTVKYSVHETKGAVSAAAIGAIRGRIVCQEPITSLSSFCGNLKLNAYPRSTSLTLMNFILRGSILKNTDFIFGVIVYTGTDTRVICHYTSKTFLERSICPMFSKYLIFIFPLILFLTMVSTILCYRVNQSIIFSKSSFKITSNQFLWRIFSVYLGIYSDLASISLFIFLEVLAFIQSDSCESTLPQCPSLKTPDLSLLPPLGDINLDLDLSRVDFIFTDKTDTLTQREFIFEKCLVAGRTYTIGHQFPPPQRSSVSSKFNTWSLFAWNSNIPLPEHSEGLMNSCPRRKRKTSRLKGHYTRFPFRRSTGTASTSSTWRQKMFTQGFTMDSTLRQGSLIKSTRRSIRRKSTSYVNDRKAPKGAQRLANSFTLGKENESLDADTALENPIKSSRYMSERDSCSMTLQGDSSKNSSSSSLLECVTFYTLFNILPSEESSKYIQDDEDVEQVVGSESLPKDESLCSDKPSFLDSTKIGEGYTCLFAENNQTAKHKKKHPRKNVVAKRSATLLEKDTSADWDGNKGTIPYGLTGKTRDGTKIFSSQRDSIQTSSKKNSQNGGLLIQDLYRETWRNRKVDHFLKALALCNSVVPCIHHPIKSNISPSHKCRSTLVHGVVTQPFMESTPRSGKTSYFRHVFRAQSKARTIPSVCTLDTSLSRIFSTANHKKNDANTLKGIEYSRTKKFKRLSIKNTASVYTPTRRSTDGQSLLRNTRHCHGHSQRSSPYKSKAFLSQYPYRSRHEPTLKTIFGDEARNVGGSSRFHVSVSEPTLFFSRLHEWDKQLPLSKKTNELRTSLQHFPTSLSKQRHDPKALSPTLPSTLSSRGHTMRKKKCLAFSFCQNAHEVEQSLPSHHYPTMVHRPIVWSPISSQDLSIIPDHTELLNSVLYRTRSPDEACLVSTASLLSYTLLCRTSSAVYLKIGNSYRYYEHLATNIWSLDRNRVSVILRSPEEPSAILYSKGVPQEMFSLLRESPQSLKQIQQTSEQFTREGLQCFVIAYRYLSSREEELLCHYCKISSTTTSCSSHNDDTHLLAQHELENNLKFLGLTGVQTKLQEGVCEVFDKIGETGIRVWMVTGDSLHQSLHVGFNSHIIARNSTIFHGDIHLRSDMAYYVDDTTYRSAYELFRKFKITRLSSDKKQALCFAVSGSSLTAYLHNEELLSLFLLMTCCSDAVLCYRATAEQKSLLVTVIKKKIKPSPVVLAIGDDFDDAQMLKTANCGVVVNSRQPSSIFFPSDFCISKFVDLKKLLFVKGRLSYLRSSSLIIFSFYKDILLMFSLFLYGCFSGYSGVIFFDWMSELSFHFILFFILLIVVHVTFSDVAPIISENLPVLYILTSRQFHFNFWILLFWLCEALIWCGVSFFILLKSLSHSPFRDAKHNGIDLGCFAYSLIHAITNMSCFKVLLSRNPSPITWIAAIVSILLFQFLVPYFWSTQMLVESRFLAEVPSRVYCCAPFWLSLFLILYVGFLFNYVSTAVYHFLFYDITQDILQAQESWNEYRLLSNKKKEAFTLSSSSPPNKVSYSLDFLTYLHNQFNPRINPDVLSRLPTSSNFKLTNFVMSQTPLLTTMSRRHHSTIVFDSSEGTKSFSSMESEHESNSQFSTTDYSYGSSLNARSKQGGVALMESSAAARDFYRHPSKCASFSFPNQPSNAFYPSLPHSQPTEKNQEGLDWWKLTSQRDFSSDKPIVHNKLNIIKMKNLVDQFFLRFKDIQLETEFQISKKKEYVRDKMWFRFVLLSLLVSYLFQIVMELYTPSVQSSKTVLGIFLVEVACFLCMLLSFTDWFYSHVEAILMIFLFIHVLGFAFPGFSSPNPLCTCIFGILSFVIFRLSFFSALFINIIFLTILLLVYLVDEIARNAFFLILPYTLGISLLTGFTGYQLEYSQRKQFLLNYQVDVSRQKQREILNTMLPSFVVNKMLHSKRDENGIPLELKTEDWPNITILFCDMYDFQKIVRCLEPTRLVELLDSLFLCFDKCAEQFGCTKIETVFETYLAASGLNSSSKHSSGENLAELYREEAFDALDMALAMLEVSTYIKYEVDVLKMKTTEQRDFHEGCKGHSHIYLQPSFEELSHNSFSSSSSQHLNQPKRDFSYIERSHAELDDSCGKPVLNDINKVFTNSLNSDADVYPVLEPCIRRVRIKIGIHSGRVISGVVGAKKPQYALFGDTVNTASRMKLTGEPDMIHVSDATYRLIEADESLQWTSRVLDIKGKGHMTTYLLTSITDSKYPFFDRDQKANTVYEKAKLTTHVSGGQCRYQSSPNAFYPKKTAFCRQSSYGKNTRPFDTSLSEPLDEKHVATSKLNPMVPAESESEDYSWHTVETCGKSELLPTQTNLFQTDMAHKAENHSLVNMNPSMNEAYGDVRIESASCSSKSRKMSTVGPPLASSSPQIPSRRNRKNFSLLSLKSYCFPCDRHRRSSFNLKKKIYSRQCVPLRYTYPSGSGSATRVAELRTLYDSMKIHTDNKPFVPDGASHPDCSPPSETRPVSASPALTAHHMSNFFTNFQRRQRGKENQQKEHTTSIALAKETRYGVQDGHYSEKTTNHTEERPNFVYTTQDSMLETENGKDYLPFSSRRKLPLQFVTLSFSYPLQEEKYQNFFYSDVSKFRNIEHSLIMFLIFFVFSTTSEILYDGTRETRTTHQSFQLRNATQFWTVRAVYTITWFSIWILFHYRRRANNHLNNNVRWIIFVLNTSFISATFIFMISGAWAFNFSQMRLEWLETDSLQLIMFITLLHHNTGLLFQNIILLDSLLLGFVFIYVHIVLPHTPETTLLLYLICPILFFNSLSAHSKEKMDRTTWFIGEERQTSEDRARELLRDMLPKQVLEEFQHDRLQLAYRHDQVTFLFADICGFTAYANSVDATEVLQTLQYLFASFDYDSTRFGLFKLCTIGDAYIAVSEPMTENSPDSNPVEGAERILEMANNMIIKIQEIREHLKIPQLSMRIGLHYGSCVGGVIGSGRLRYGLWGLDVLTGNLMESNGVPGHINVSDNLKQFLEEQFPNRFFFRWNRAVVVIDRIVNSFLLLKASDTESATSKPPHQVVSPFLSQEESKNEQHFSVLGFRFTSNVETRPSGRDRTCV